MPNIYKIGFTERLVDDRLKEANSSNTWSPPYPYEVMCSVETNDAKIKEGLIHDILKTYRVKMDREFFKDVPVDMIKSIFKLVEISGDRSMPRLSLPTKPSESVERERSPRETIVLEDYLTNGQLIRHRINSQYLEGMYDLKKNKIITTSGQFSTLTEFVRYHEDSMKIKRKGSFLWKECDIYRDNKWIPLEKID